MADNRSQKIFNEFDSIFKNTWKDLALKDLKDGESFENLIWKLDELAIDPFYTLSDLEKLKTLDFFNKENANKSPGWLYLETLWTTNSKEANKIALNTLANGADGIIFNFENPELFSEDILKNLLEGILPEHCIISFKSKSSPEDLLNNYFNLIKSRGLSLTELSGSLDYDPLSEWTLTGNEDFLNFIPIKPILETTSLLPQFSGISINGEVFTNSGASAVQQIALLICELNDYIELLSGLGLPPHDIFRNIKFNVSIGKNFFVEIAKVRALKLLVYKLAHLYKVPGFKASEVKIHATTAWWSKSAIEPHHNILRNTTEAMAAILGGCNTLSIVPHDISNKEPDDFSRRVARNISNILREETFLHKVLNPADGSYYLEKLTEMVVDKTWNLVQDIENQGGFIKAFKGGYIIELVKKNYEVQIENVLKAKDKIVGVNFFKSKQSGIENIKNNHSGWFEFDRASAVLEQVNNS